MMCAWKELLSILPVHLRLQVDSLGREALQELRLRLHMPPEMLLGNHSHTLPGCVKTEDMEFVVNMASQYSPWVATTIAKGFLTAPGGHRIGVCGEAVCRDGFMQGIRQIHSLCIRVARDFPGIGEGLAGLSGSVLILGPPGAGKTTLLRDLIRQISKQECVSVVDERLELFPAGFFRGKQTDVLLGCPKHIGVEQLLRTMSPKCIAVDEITEEKDCLALQQAANCGVRLLATAHAGSIADLKRRPIYRKLIENEVFETTVVLLKDKSYKLERMAA